MEVYVPGSFCIISNFILKNSSKAYPGDNEQEEFYSLPEIYSRFLLCKSINHANLCRYIDLEQVDTDSLVIISESYTWTLEKVYLSRVDRAKRQDFNENEVAEIAYDILSGLKAMTNLSTAFLELKPENLVFSEDGFVKLCHPFDYFILNGFKPSSEYSPPEQPSGPVFLFKSDTWSLAIIIIELLKQRKYSSLEGFDKTEFFDLENLKVSEKFKDFIANLINEDYNKRFDCIDAVQHPYFHMKIRKIGSCIKVNEIYYLWKQFKDLNSEEKLKEFFIGMVNSIGSMRNLLLNKPNLCFMIKRSIIHLENFAHECKKELDCGSSNENKGQSENLSVKQGSIIGKISGIFGSKSVKSSDSGSTSRSKPPDRFTDFITRYKSYASFINISPVSFIPVPSDGFPVPLRTEIWKKLLNIPPGYHHCYTLLKETSQLESNKQISLDIPRCHKHNLFLTSSSGRATLELMLKIWVSQTNRIKYSQGLDSIAATCLILYESDEAAAYYTFSSIICKYLLPVLINEDLVGNYLLILRNLVSFLDPVLANHLHSHNINPEMYATSWLLTLYSRNTYSDNFPLSSVFVIWDLLLQQPPEFSFVVAYSILQQFRDELLAGGQNEIIGFLSGINLKIDLERCIEDSLAGLQVVPLGICRLVTGYGGKLQGKDEWEKELSLDLAQATRVPLINMRDCEEIKDDYLIVDTRSVEDYKSFMINGSVNLPVKIGNNSGVLPSIKLTHAQLQGLKDHSAGKTIILVGDHGLAVHSLGNILVKQNVPRVCILRGGILAIKAMRA